jgi:hypothetical protein
MHTARDTGRTRADNPALPSRRGLLAASASALVAGAAIATAAHGALVASPGGAGDAELIAACDRIVAIRAELVAINAADPWAPDEGPLHAKFEALLDERYAIEESVYDMSMPTTQAGAQAIARAALAGHARGSDGNLEVNNFETWLMLSLAEFQAGAAFEESLAASVARDNQDGRAAA